MVQVIAASALEERFGAWPSFHDAEVQAVRLDSGQRAGEKPSVELDIHLFEVEGPPVHGKLRYVHHTLVTLRLEGAEDIELGGFGPQNVLWDLVIEDAPPPGTAGVLVSLPSSNGLSGSVRCEAVVVTAVHDFIPGPASVYHEGN